MRSAGMLGYGLASLASREAEAMWASMLALRWRRRGPGKVLASAGR